MAVINLDQSAEPSADELHCLIMRTMVGINARGFRAFGNQVLTGPFIGMTIPERNEAWDDGNSGTKLLGLYEWELNAAFETLFWRRPKTIINVGCAEGYYAIGFARMFPNIRIYAADILSSCLYLCAEYAAINNVASRIALIDGCQTPEEMRFPEIKGHRFYLIDVEGAEIDLVDLERCPELVNSDLVIECHDNLRPETTADLMDRLSATHRVELIRSRFPDLNQFQFAHIFSAVAAALFAVEKRPQGCYWLACWANTKGV